MDEQIESSSQMSLSIIAVLSAGILGFVCGILLAPQSGSRTRRQLHNAALDAKEQVDEWTEDAKETVDHFLLKHGKNAERAYERV